MRTALRVLPILASFQGARGGSPSPQDEQGPPEALAITTALSDASKAIHDYLTLCARGETAAEVLADIRADATLDVLIESGNEILQAAIKGAS